MCKTIEPGEKKQDTVKVLFSRIGLVEITQDEAGKISAALKELSQQKNCKLPTDN